MTQDNQVRQVRFNDEQIEMAHGAGGKATRRLIEGLIAPLLSNPALDALGDSAIIELGDHRLAVTADSFVVSPLRFSGGSIGTLAVNGTVNDLSVAGAEPRALLAAFIIEAGFPAQSLKQEIDALGAAARSADVSIVGGDTKVVEHGKADGLYITTAGFGLVDTRVSLDATSVRPGDQILLSGPIGDHGITILLARGEVGLAADLSSDTRPIMPFIKVLIDEAASCIRWMRDPTRGGVASALNELARDASVGVRIFEDRLPVRPEVRGACEILGLDPLHIANEGQFVAVLDAEKAETALDAVKRVPGGEEAVIIGEVIEEPARRVLSVTTYGGTRVVDMLVGDPLPRIC